MNLQDAKLNVIEAMIIAVREGKFSKEEGLEFIKTVSEIKEK